MRVRGSSTTNHMDVSKHKMDLNRPEGQRIGYLVSQYPATSHTFIRREIAALREMGIEVDTFSVRPAAQSELKEAKTFYEALNTFTLLNQSIYSFITAHVRALFRSP